MKCSTKLEHQLFVHSLYETIVYYRTNGGIDMTQKIMSDQLRAYEAITKDKVKYGVYQS